MQALLNSQYHDTILPLNMIGGPTMTPEKIARINELAKKSRTFSLSTAEKEEQASLRQEYIVAIRTNLRAQLETIEIVDAPQSH